MVWPLIFFLIFVRRLEARPGLEVLPEDLHDHVVEAHVQILGDLHVVRRDVEVEVRQFVELPAVVAGHADDLAADLLRVLDRLDHVLKAPELLSVEDKGPFFHDLQTLNIIFAVYTSK